MAGKKNIRKHSDENSTVVHIDIRRLSEVDSESQKLKTQDSTLQLLQLNQINEKKNERRKDKIAVDVEAATLLQLINL